MKKANKEHPVYVSLRDWSKVRKANIVAEKTEHIPSLSVLPEKNVEVQRIRYGVHSIVKVTCKGYKDETVYQGAYLATILTYDNPESEIIQQVLDDIKGIKGIDEKPRINTITMYTEDDFGERHVFFDLDDCESVLFS